MGYFPSRDGLHQDKLEEVFGDITTKLFVHNDYMRIAHLVCPKKISRTYALTFFPKERENGDIKVIDEEIHAGGTIGRTFKKYGYEVGRNFLAEIILELPEWLKKEFDTGDTYAYGQISELYAKNESSLVIYGDIIEILTPHFRRIPNLYYSSNFEPPIIDVKQINPSTEELEKEGFSREDIWERIRKGNIWLDVQDRYDRAKTNSCPTVSDLLSKSRSLILNNPLYNPSFASTT